MRRLLWLVPVMVIGSAVAAICDGGKGATFTAPREKVYSVALDVIQSEWRVNRTEKDSGLIAFTTRRPGHRGVDVSFVLAEDGGITTITSSAKKPGGGLMIPTHESDWKTTQKTLRLIGERLHKDGLIPESEIPKK